MEDPDLVRRRCELDQVVLFGWSYHGGVVANYAGRHPDVVLRMVLSGPIAPRRIPYSEQAAAMLQSRLDMTAIGDFMKSPPADPAEASKAWHAIILRGYFADSGAYARSVPKPCESENERPPQCGPARKRQYGPRSGLGTGSRGGPFIRARSSSPRKMTPETPGMP